MKKIVVFAGDSFTAGNGWKDIGPEQSKVVEVKDCEHLWVNLCHRNINTFQSMDLLNLGQGGASNTEIFENVIDAISVHNNRIAYVICQWTSMPRYNFDAGFELWPTQEKLQLVPGRSEFGIGLNRGVSWSRDYLNDLLNRFLALHHLHGEIVKVVRYTNIIDRLCCDFGIRAIFVNGLCPWDKNYFDVMPEGTMPVNYTEFTKTEILNIDTRDDQDIFKLYYQAHQDYSNAGGINSNNWINLYNSFRDQKLDTNYDNLHPGKLSNQLYFQQIKNFLETQ
jgi:hypothetical protein